MRPASAAAQRARRRGARPFCNARPRPPLLRARGLGLAIGSTLDNFNPTRCCWLLNKRQRGEAEGLTRAGTRLIARLRAAARLVTAVPASAPRHGAETVRKSRHAGSETERRRAGLAGFGQGAAENAPGRAALMRAERADRVPRPASRAATAAQSNGGVRERGPEGQNEEAQARGRWCCW